jgi:hypothetical protein
MGVDVSMSLVVRQIADVSASENSGGLINRGEDVRDHWRAVRKQVHSTGAFSPIEDWPCKFGKCAQRCNCRTSLPLASCASVLGY